MVHGWPEPRLGSGIKACFRIGEKGFVALSGEFGKNVL